MERKCPLHGAKMSSRVRSASRLLTAQRPCILEAACCRYGLAASIASLARGPACSDNCFAKGAPFWRVRWKVSRRQGLIDSALKAPRPLPTANAKQPFKEGKKQEKMPKIPVIAAWKER